MMYCFEYLILAHFDVPFIEIQLEVVYNFLSFI